MGTNLPGFTLCGNNQGNVGKFMQVFLFSESSKHLLKKKTTLKALNNPGKVFQPERIAHYIQHAERQIDQIGRRVLEEPKQRYPLLNQCSFD